MPEPERVTSNSIYPKCIRDFQIVTLHNPSYLPKDEFDDFLQGDRIKATIQMERAFQSYRSKRKKDLIEYSRRNPKVFLTLAVTDLIKKMPLLFSEKFEDKDFPVRLELKEGSGPKVFSVSGTQHRPWECFVLGDDEDHEWAWAELEHFVSKQWMFSAFTFDTRSFMAILLQDCPLPYFKLGGMAIGGGHFGKVFKLGLRAEHIIPQSSRVHEVAVKQLHVDGANDQDLTSFFNKERITLETMRKLDHCHLIKAISAYERGSERCFVFPWATGGNLRELWNRGTGPTRRETMRWAWDQIQGLTEGITMLHKDNTRHGDLKPENILVFGNEGKTKLGELVVADVGIAKYHADETAKRQAEGKNTTNKYETMRYGPPKIELGIPGKTETISRKYDSWSLGCILLEFIIWLLRGPTGQERFNDEGRNATPRLDSFWIHESNQPPMLHPVVKRWMNEELNQDWKDAPALQDLMTLIGDQLLVASLKKRKYIREFYQSLEDLIKKKIKGPITLERVGSKIKVLSTDQHIISLYCDQVSQLAVPFAKPGLPLLPEVASPEEFSLLKSLLHHCDEKHHCMKEQKYSKVPERLPTRVIDVGRDGTNSIRLLDNTIEDSGITGRYIALSHCWGKAGDKGHFCTSKLNIEERKAHISYEELPASFQDAVRVTRSLGVRYLWIDSLCIIQGDDEDWATEAGRMEDVFSGAYCTIAASSAASSSVGFLGKRRPRDVIKLPMSGGTPLYLAEDIDDFRADVENSGLSSRGWVFQERALSRRTIYFTSAQIYWECGNGVVCETLAQLQNPQSRFLGDSDFPSFGLQFYKDERIRLVQHFYETYSTLALSYATDRTKAVAGLQRRIARVFNSEVTYGIVWNWLERTLLWRAAQSGSLTRIVYTETAEAPPSWSWMAYEGPISFLEIHFAGVEWAGNVHKPSPAEGYERVQAEATGLCLNGADLMERVVLDVQDVESSQDSWMCVLIGKAKPSSDGEEVGTAHYVLLIRPISTPGEPSDIYERVGVATLLASHLTSDTRSVSIV
ncbi:hypothetical protein N0V93_007867 [Gnomoniopsis smithogilvyi]|uniref:Protein kinase domain-containing protein n=1 Tax=Gnomoniopsis smithogilvyi TaxID=1191159 RepID=A0A9W8YN40_9PEZI|nr:hypothetical protein N0V93_007867 [Gnomoniopsis smithogilvyi]